MESILWIVTSKLDRATVLDETLFHGTELDVSEFVNQYTVSTGGYIVSATKASDWETFGVSI